MLTKAPAWPALGACAALVACTGCSEGNDPLGPRPPGSPSGSLQVSVSTTGPSEWVDTDGFALVLDADEARDVESNGALTIEGLVAGPHRLELRKYGLACAVAGDNPRIVTVPAGGTLTTTFEVECREPPPPLTNRIAFESDARIGVVGEDGSGRMTLTSGGFSDYLPAVSPDGRWILFTRSAEERTDIYVMNAEGTGVRNLTDHPGVNDRARWSPDGTRIAFSRNLNIYAMNADGSDPVNLTRSSASNNAPAWSPDGTRIAFTSDRSGEFEIWVMNADGSDPVNLTSAPASSDYAPAWSPDGTRIAYTAIDRGPNGSGGDEIVVMDADGSNRVTLTDGYWPSWSPDGERISFTSIRTGSADVFVIDADGSNLRNVTDSPGTDEIAGFPQAWSPS